MKKSIISRTVSTNIATALSVDIETRTVDTVRTSIPVKYDTTDKALAFLRKNDSCVVAVEKLERSDKLVGMYESDFIANAEQFPERSKDCRGMVTKECVTKSARVMAVKDRKVVDVTYVGAYDEKTARNACKNDGLLFVQLIAVDESKQLYGMTPEKFAQLAKPMKDRFTLA